MRIALVANFVAPASGGIRTVLRALADGYARHGHEVVLVVPGARDGRRRQPWGLLVTLAAPRVPGTGYRVLVRPRRVARVLEELRPDRLEVHDRSTLRALGPWARRAGVPSLVVSHERLDRLAGQWLPGPAGRPAGAALADASNAALAAGFDAVVCTTRWAAAEFERLGVQVRRVPLGVDLRTFTPAAGTGGGPVARLVVASRLSREKHVELAVDAVAHLRASGRPVRLLVAGDGPARHRLQRRARGLPVRFAGFLPDRAALAAQLAAADVAIAPGPVETFGLAALEALACGTPVVAHADSAVGEVLGAGAGTTAPGTGAGFAHAVEAVLGGAADGVRARARAERFSWERTVEGFLAVHGAEVRGAEVRGAEVHGAARGPAVPQGRSGAGAGGR
ncbi:glycosyltransferase [Kineococcus gypseus]|uniref:glycosyltransferase n=1 Tax=Kineococcus gypseus TaxID=1637102 RepID=UPI003D7EA741